MADNAQTQLGRLNLLEVVIYNNDASKKQTITNLIKHIEIIEDIFKNTMHGEVRIKDSVDLLNGGPHNNNKNGFPIVGEEFIEITYATDYTKSGIVTPRKLRFAVFRIEDMLYFNNNTKKEYTLKFCSAEHLIDAVTPVMKAYKKQNSDNVKDLCRDYLNLDDGSNGTSTAGPASSGNTATGSSSTLAPLPMIPFSEKKKILAPQPTKGPQNIVIPRLSPLQAAEFFARRSIAEDEKYKSASYLFFENMNGFNFCDIEYLIEQGIKQAKTNLDKYTYYHENPLVYNSKTKQAEKDPHREFKTVHKINHVNYFDTIQKLKLGIFESDTIIFDYINHKMTPQRYRFFNNETKDNNLSITLGAAPDNKCYPENSMTFMNKVISPDDTVNKYTRKFFIPKNLALDYPDTYLDQVYATRASYFARLSQNMYQAITYGDMEIKAGDVIIMNIPKGDGLNLNHNNDDRVSGYFLVGTIKHSFTQSTYMTTVDLYKNSYGIPITSTIDSENAKLDNNSPHPVTPDSFTPTEEEVPPADNTDPKQNNTSNNSPTFLKVIKGLLT